MIKLDFKTKKDFLSPDWMEKLIDVGVDTSDAYYFLVQYGNPYNTDMGYHILSKEEKEKLESCNEDNSDIFIPTYTTSNLIYKLKEYVKIPINNKLFYGELCIFKKSPLFSVYYRLRNKIFAPRDKDVEYNEDYLKACLDTPIEALAALLIQCHLKGVGDTGNIG
jgi:hypothetical protein